MNYVYQFNPPINILPEDKLYNVGIFTIINNDIYEYNEKYSRYEKISLDIHKKCKCGNTNTTLISIYKVRGDESPKFIYFCNNCYSKFVFNNSRNSCSIF